MKNKIFLFLFVGLFIHHFGFSQSQGIDKIPYYAGVEFKGQFAYVAEEDDRSNYFVVDLTQFKSYFEKSYFESYTFQIAGLTRLDAGNSSIAWFKVPKSKSTEYLELLTKLKDFTVQSSLDMTEQQKQDWLTRNGK